MNGYDVLNSLVVGAVGIATSIYTLRRTRIDSSHARIDQMIEQLLETLEETHSDAINQLVEACVIGHQEDPAEKKKLLEHANVLDNWTLVIRRLNIIKTKLTLLKIPDGLEAMKDYVRLLIDTRESADRGGVDPEQFNIANRFRASSANQARTGSYSSALQLTNE